MWVLSVALALGAILLMVFVLPFEAPRASGGLAVASLLAAVFYLVDAGAQPFENRLDPFTRSLRELPFVLGLLFCPLGVLIAARVIGGSVALIARRRQSLEKALFSFTLQTFEATCGATVFSLAPGNGTTTLSGDGVATGLAALSASIIAVGGIAVMLRLRSGCWEIRSARPTGVLAWVPSCCAALLIAEAVWRSHFSIVPALAVGIALALGYRAHMDLRRRHETLGMVYDFACSIDANATSEERLRVLLERTREALRCEDAEVVLLPAHSDEPATRRTLDSSNQLISHARDSHSEDWPVDLSCMTGEPVLGSSSASDAATKSFLSARGWRDCILVQLTDRHRVVGLLGVGNRISDVPPFAREDGRLLTTIAGQVSSVLENGQLLDRLTHDSSHDSLTGLVNRTTYQSTLASSLVGPTQSVAVLIMDLDRFKEVNDTLGHHCGDLLIRVVADRLRSATPLGATIARLGGDEFALLLPGLDREAARTAAMRLRAAVAQPCSLDGVALDIEASIGIALAPEQGSDPTVLLKRADMAMYAAKRAHSGIEFYDGHRDEYSPRRLTLASQIRSAGANGQLELQYQPQLDLQTGEITGVEALMRWHHPDLGMVPPSEFIAIAEQSGAISLLTRWGLDEAVRQLVRWRAIGLPLEMSVNVSMRNLLDTSTVDQVDEAVRQYGLPPGALTLEVTESQLMAEPDRTLPLLHRLASLGVRLSIDDFGTGYSSLAYLKHLPVREIKIDRSFVKSITESAEDVAIVRAVIDLARCFGMTVVAEGVEDHATMQLLQSLGCHRLQGYHISRPMSASHVPLWIARNSAEWREQIRFGGVRRLTNPMTRPASKAPIPS